MEDSPFLADEQFRALAKLGTLSWLDRFYLAGGTGVAAHLHHRLSVDLDLFSQDAAVDLSDVGRRLVAELDDAEVVAQTDATLTLRAGDVAIDIVRYPYALLEPPTPGPAAFPVASLRDLAAMKLAAIGKRGVRRDFWDLYAITSSSPVGLRPAADAYLQKFGVREADLYHVSRALTYFDDAEAEPVMPRGLTKETWAAIKEHFIRSAPALLRSE